VYSAISDLYTPDKIKFFKADTDVHEDLIDKYKLQGLPLFAIFKDGKIVASHSGALNKDKLTKFVDKALSG
jgi:thioredoxin 1